MEIHVSYVLEVKKNAFLRNMTRAVGFEIEILYITT